MKDKKILILSIVGVLMLVSIVVATSYAYFTATVSGNKDTNNVVITNGVMSLEYKDGDEITLDNAVPGDSVTKTFTVKNTGNVSTNYTIYFSELSNKFVDKTDLVYTLTSTDGGKNVSQTQVPDSNEAMVSNYSIEAGKTHTYTLTITFLNKDEVQDDNQGKKFSTKVTINESVEYVEPNVVTQISEFAVNDTTNFATDDPDNNIRYIGADPNNYIYFNCSDYQNQNDSTCEKWRIIGVFKNVKKEDTSTDDLVKIIRDKSLKNLYFDFKGSGLGTSTEEYGSNDWSDSQLMMMLNPIDYLKSGYTIENDSVMDINGKEIYQKVGSYYGGTVGCEPSIVSEDSNFSCTSIDFTSTGLKNDLTRNVIESVVWNLGGIASYRSSTDGLASDFYANERGNAVYSGHATTWTGKIGLMYPSDFGYATAGGSTMDRLTCLSKELFNWDTANDCRNNDYFLLESSYKQWMLSPNSSSSNSVFYLQTNGMSGPYYTGNIGYVADKRVDDSLYDVGVRPTLYLKSTISISKGEGSSERPYQLNLQ